MSNEPIPEELVVDGRTIRGGSRVRLRPGPRADILDIALRGQTAIVDAIEQDMEGRIHLAVTLADDPGRDLSARVGQRFFFGPDEVEPIDEGTGAPPPRILLAGIGNVFLGDDGFGVAVIDSLRRRSLPRNVDAVDFGIRGMDLVYALGNGYRTVVLVDAAPRGHEPGTVSLVEPDPDERPATLDTHHMDPVNVLRQAKQTGPLPERVLLVACEPQQRLPDDAADVVAELSPAVRAAVGQAVEMIVDLLEELAGQDLAGEVSK